MKKLLRISAWTLGCTVLLLGLVFIIAWKSPKHYKIGKSPSGSPLYVPFRNYTGEHSRPYVIETKNAIIFGAEHTRDPKHAEIRLIEEKWKNSKPTIALVEGRLGFLLPIVMDPVENLGEGGKVKELAQKDDVPVYNWDLSKEELATGLLKKYSKEQIALSQILQPYFSQVRFGKPDAEAFLKPFFKRAAYVGLQDSIKTVQDIDRTWKKYFSDKDWRNVSDEHELPGYLSHMMAAVNDLRNQQLISVVKELTGRGEKVFLICGSSHAWCVQPAFER